MARDGGNAWAVVAAAVGRLGSPGSRRAVGFWGAALVLAGSVAFAAPPAAAGALPVDEFDGLQELCLTPRDKCEPQDTGDASIASSLPVPEVLGGERDLELLLVSGMDGARLSVDDAGQGQLSFTVGFETEAEAILVWDGDDGDPMQVDPDGLGGIDLLAEGSGDALRLKIDSLMPVDLSVRIYDALDPMGDTWSEFSVLLMPTAGFETLDVPLVLEPDASGPDGPADLSQVGALELRILGEASQDLLIDSVQFVPEPAGGAAAALGALGLLARMARGRSARR